VAEIEEHWGALVGRAKFDEVCYLLDELLTKLTDSHDG
jgi:hypothetical protein